MNVWLALRDFCVEFTWIYFGGKAEENKKLREPFLPKFTEAETPQVTTAKLPHGTRKHPLRAATFLS